MSTPNSNAGARRSEQLMLGGVVAIFLITVALVWAPRIYSALQRSSQRFANRGVYVMIDPTSSIDRDFLAGVKGARRTQKGIGDEANTDLTVLSMPSTSDLEELERTLCRLPAAIRTCDAAPFVPQELVVLGPNDSTQVKLLHRVLTNICRAPHDPNCPAQAASGCGDLRGARWNVRFLVGNATTVKPPNMDVCEELAWQPLKFALPDNKQQAEALFKLVRDGGYKRPLLVLQEGTNPAFVQSMAQELMALDSPGVPEKKLLRTCDLDKPAKTPAEAKASCPLADSDAFIALSDLNSAPRVLEKLHRYLDRPVFAADTWTPSSVFKHALDLGAKRVCVVATRHNAELKTYVRHVRDPARSVLPYRWKLLEMVRYSLGWDLYRTYTSLLEGRDGFDDSWELTPDGKQRVRVSINLETRPIWKRRDREIAFTPRCCPRADGKACHEATTP